MAELPSAAQAAKLGKHYRLGKQAFGLIVGQEYLVFALKLLDGQAWVEITDPSTVHSYLFSAPLCLFTITDHRVPNIWEARVTEAAELKLAPRSFFAEFYYDDLFEGIQSAVEDFRSVRWKLEREDEQVARR